jgi:O-antigen/teichoic acid export membrane protein
VLIVIAIIAYGFEAGAWPAIVAAACILFFGPASVFSAALNGMQKIEKWMIWFLGHKVVGLLVVVGMLRPLHGGLTMALATGALANFVMMFYAAAALWGDGWGGELRWNRREVRAMVGGSVTVALTAAVTRLAMEIDTFVLAFFAPDAVVGVYAAGKRIISPAGQILNGAVSVPTFPGLCRLAGENRAEFGRWSTQLCVIQWTAGMALALAAWAVAPYVVPLLLKGGFDDTVGVIQITVWSVVPLLFALQLRYTYIALSREGRFVAYNLVYLVLKIAILALLTWKFKLWGACYGAVLSELVLAALVWLGVTAVDAPLRLVWPLGSVTVATAACLAVLWKLGADHKAAFVFVAAAYLIVAVYVVDRLMRTVREHVPRVARGEEAAAGAVSG